MCRLTILAALLVAGCTADNPTYLLYVAPVRDLGIPADLDPPDLASSCGHFIGDSCCFEPPITLLCDRGMSCDESRHCAEAPDLAVLPDLRPAPPDFAQTRYDLLGGACAPLHGDCNLDSDCCSSDAGPVACLVHGCFINR